MHSARSSIAITGLIAAFMLVGCADDTTELKGKIAALEQRVIKQDKSYREFSGKFAPPKDFSADLQRIEDQQDRINQTLKTKVDPINIKLEEFRDWAQDAQKERSKVAIQLKEQTKLAGELKKRLQRAADHEAKLKSALDKISARSHRNAKALKDLRQEMLNNNAKMLSAIKKTLPKVRDAAVAEIKTRLTPIEKGLTNLKSGVAQDRKTLSDITGQTKAQSTKEAKALLRKVNELEEILAAQKTFLLEMGSKMHELEIRVKGVPGT
jgi:chromosome segregation ATPase